MKDAFTIIKIAISAIGSFLASALGGWNPVLSLLILLMAVDLVTGFSLAIINKEVSSSKMRLGIFRKFITFVTIFIGYRFDVVMIHSLGELPVMWGISLSAKMFMTVYFCFEENLSVIENCANLGVPTPKWLRSILKQVSDDVNDSTPDKFISILKKLQSFFSKYEDSDGKSNNDESV